MSSVERMKVKEVKQVNENHLDKSQRKVLQKAGKWIMLGDTIDYQPMTNTCHRYHLEVSISCPLTP